MKNNYLLQNCLNKLLLMILFCGIPTFCFSIMDNDPIYIDSLRSEVGNGKSVSSSVVPHFGTIIFTIICFSMLIILRWFKVNRLCNAWNIKLEYYILHLKENMMISSSEEAELNRQYVYPEDVFCHINKWTEKQIIKCKLIHNDVEMHYSRKKYEV